MLLFHKFSRDNHDCLFKVSSLWIWAEIWWFSRIIPNIPRRALLEFSANGLKGWNAANILREPGRILRETRGNTAESSQKCLKWLEKLIPLKMKAYNLWDEWRKMDEIRMISGTYHKLGYGQHILFAPISKSSWLCQAVISKSIFGADDVADNGGRPSLLSSKEILVDWFEVQQG